MIPGVGRGGGGTPRFEASVQLTYPYRFTICDVLMVSDPLAAHFRLFGFDGSRCIRVRLHTFVYSGVITSAKPLVLTFMSQRKPLSEQEQECVAN